MTINSRGTPAPTADLYDVATATLLVPNGEPLGFATQLQRLQSVRAFFSWLSKNHYLLYNPAADLELPKTPRQKLPRQVRDLLDQLERALAEGEPGALWRAEKDNFGYLLCVVRPA